MSSYQFDGDAERVGFWKRNGRARPIIDHPLAMLIGALAEAHLPSVFDSVDPNWSPAERDKVLRYLSHDQHRRTAYMGFSTCRICGKENGCADVSDGTFVWPDGMGHYVRDHAVRPPARFVAHALRRMDRLDEYERLRG